MPRMIEVQGSWGALLVDRATGVIVEASHEPLSDEDIRSGTVGYRNIGMFEPSSLAREGEATDILYLGYFTRDGAFEPALTDRTVRAGGEMILDLMVPFALLPAPQEIRIDS